MANQIVTRVLGLVSLLSLISSCHAFEFKVGGSQGWTFPSDPNAAVYNHWAEKSRFQVGDSLLFVYPSDHDSVLHVTKEDYDSCNTDKPLDKFADGHTVYKLNQSGPHYFISGVADNCRKNEKLIVVVMAERNKNNGSNGTAEVPSPPSPAPSGEESPAPPLEDADAPSEESSPPKNGASSVAAGVVGTIAVLFGFSLALDNKDNNRIIKDLQKSIDNLNKKFDSQSKILDEIKNEIKPTSLYLGEETVLKKLESLQSYLKKILGEA